MFASLSRVIASFLVFHHIFFVKQYIFKNSFSIHQALIEYMFLIIVGSLTTRQQRFCFYFFTELNSTDKTVAIYPISFYRTRKCTTGIGGQHSPCGRYKSYGDAWFAVVKLMINSGGYSLKPVDTAPGHLPTAKFLFQVVDAGQQRQQ